MPQKDKIELYRSIKAPEQLRERVLSLEAPKHNRRTFRTFAAAAAFAVIAASALGFMGYTDVDVFSGGAEIGGEPASVLTYNESARMRACTHTPIDLEVEVNAETVITASGADRIMVYDPENGGFLPEQSSVTVNGRARIVWNVYDFSLSGEDNCLLFETLGRTQKYILETNEDGYTLRLEK